MPTLVNDCMRATLEELISRHFWPATRAAATHWSRVGSSDKSKPIGHARQLLALGIASDAQSVRTRGCGSHAISICYRWEESPYLAFLLLSNKPPMKTHF